MIVLFDFGDEYDWIYTFLSIPTSVSLYSTDPRCVFYFYFIASLLLFTEAVANHKESEVE